MAVGSGAAAVRIFTAPDAACSGGASWAATVAFLRDRLSRRCAEDVTVEHVELFSQRSFDFPAVLEAIQGGAQLPVVLVGDEIVSQGAKLSEPVILRALQTQGLASRRE